ncbi:putative cyclase-domain-containing protein [Aspergillus pseudodeflectus]|uniref:Cyclase-domain-containing protein n=1 Tax=Aspergillus pseudodeflectus TaxID=176178 RepID=A0ABR4JQ64_9EURO
MTTPSKLPSFDQLPLNEGDPPYSAWGLWGEDSALGSLNYLTDEVVAKAVQEVKTGERVALNLPLDFFNPPLLGRAGFEQKVIDKNPLVVNDDVITFNTQGSSQWDSFRHFAYQADKKFYNGTTQDEIHASGRTSINGLQAWCSRGLAGRGVLVDYASYARRHGIEINHFSGHAITLKDVLAAAAEQDVEFRTGDVLFLRTGYVAAYQELDSAGRERVAQVREWCGLGQSRETTEWLWERQFAAVASDSPGFEVRPPVEKQWHLHPILLAGWGTPLGELFDLEALAAICARTQRWSFFFTSSPLNYMGAVASPPNAMAIL